jgi:hypothetical protein
MQNYWINRKGAKAAVERIALALSLGYGLRSATPSDLDALLTFLRQHKSIVVDGWRFESDGTNLAVWKV